MAQIEADGVLWEIDYGTHDEIGPWHEQELTPLVLSLIPDDGVFLDVGAHVGHYAIRAAARPGVTVYAVEPNPDTAERLRENVKINSFTNVHVIELAAWNGVKSFRIQKVHESYLRDGSNRVLPDAHGTVWGARLDDAMNQWPLRPERLDLIKLDVEGADLEAIDGMRGLIGRHKPVLFIEDHSEYGYYRQEDLLALIEDLGYSHEEVTWGHSTYWKCTPAPEPSTPEVPA